MSHSYLFSNAGHSAIHTRNLSNGAAGAKRRLLGISTEAVPSLVLPPGRSSLTRLLTPVPVVTDSVDRYKSWIGVDDANTHEMAGILDPSRLTADVIHRLVRAESLFDLSEDDRLIAEAMGRQYIFGSSGGVRRHATLIKKFFAPFEAHAVLAGTVDIPAGAELVVDRFPTVAIIDRLVIHAGGRLTLLTWASVTVNQLEKRP